MQFNDNKAIYIQIAERISDEVLLGTFGEDERILSVRDYAAHMEVNTNTALRSYAYLEQMGILYQKRGLGYFISPEAKRIITEHRQREFFDDTLPEVFKRMNILGISMNEIEELYNKHFSATSHAQL